MNFKNFVLDKSDNITTITLNRPEVLNAFNREMWLELRNALDDAMADSNIRVIVLTGAGRAFSAGMDAKAAKDFTDTAHESYIKLEYAVCAYIESLGKLGAIPGRIGFDQPPN